MQYSFIGKLLHLSDPTLPIGGYTQSNGLETYVQNGLVNNKASAAEYVKNNLWYNLRYNDAALMKLAYDATKVEDVNELLKLDQECEALKSPMEVRVSSQKLGLRLFKIFSRYIENPIIEQWKKWIRERECNTHYCVLFGVFAALMNVPLEEALHGFYYNAAIGMVTNAVKLVPLGQLEGQDILFELHEDLEKLVKESLNLDRNLVGMCNIGIDIRCMQHERLYSRLYLS